MKIFTADWVFTGTDWKQGVFLQFEGKKFVRYHENHSELFDSISPTHVKGILCPGFVNAHCHLELSHLRGKVSKGTGLPGFIKGLQAARTMQISKEQHFQQMFTADEAMFVSGIQAVGDIANGPDSIDVKAGSKIFYHTFVECFGIRNGEEQKSFIRGAELVSEFKEKLGTERVSLVPHALYSTSSSLVASLMQHSAERGLPISIHFMEDASEEAFLQFGKGPFAEMLRSFGIPPEAYLIPARTAADLVNRLAPALSNLLLVHGLHMSESDWAKIHKKHRHLYLVLCASANRYISGLLPSPRRIPAEYLCLGTDSLASNDSLDLMNEMRILGELGFTIREMMPWATYQGAKALHMADCCGSFIPGKDAGLLHIKNVAPDDLPNAAEVVRIF